MHDTRPAPRLISRPDLRLSLILAMPLQFYACEGPIAPPQENEHMLRHRVLKIDIPEIDSQPYVIYVLAATELHIGFQPHQLPTQARPRDLDESLIEFLRLLDSRAAPIAMR